MILRYSLSYSQAHYGGRLRKGKAIPNSDTERLFLRRKLDWRIKFLVILQVLLSSHLGYPSRTIGQSNVFHATGMISQTQARHISRSLYLSQQVFLRVLRFSPLLKNQHFQIPIRSGNARTRLTEFLRTSQCFTGVNKLHTVKSCCLNILVFRQLCFVCDLLLQCNEKRKCMWLP